MVQQNDSHPWQQIEEQAFHAFREWPIWLVLRERELTQQTQKPEAKSTTQPTATQAATGTTHIETVRTVAAE